jgi:hypothetical protein
VRSRGGLVIAALAVAAMIAAGGTVWARSGGPVADLPASHPAAIFPTTWPGDSTSPRWHAGGGWRLRDSATTSPNNLAFEFQLRRWPFPKQFFVVAGRCDTGTLTVDMGAGEVTGPCIGDFRAVVGSTLPAEIKVHVSQRQQHDWGIAVYSRPV